MIKVHVLIILMAVSSSSPSTETTNFEDVVWDTTIPFSNTVDSSKHSGFTTDFPPQNLLFCPEGFEYYNHDNYPVCFTLTAPQPFPPKCPYPNILSLTDLTEIKLLDKFKDESLWAMIVRNTTNGFNQFESINKDVSYRTPIKNYVRLHGNISESNCMVITNNLLIPVNCEMNYVALCAYPYNTNAISAYCKTHFEYIENGYSSCIADNINIENSKCYCELSYTTPSQLIPNKTCSVLAEPRQQFQTILLLTQLDSVNDRCWFGLHVDETGALRWKHSEQSVNYTFWASDVDQSKTQGALRFVIPTGWILEDAQDDNNGIMCEICELENEYKRQVKIELSFVPKWNAVRLKIDNFLEMSDYFGRYYSLFCFVGPTTENFKERILSATFYVQDVPHNVNQSKSWIRYIDNAWKYPVYYWCEAFQRPDFKQIFSNKLLVANNTGSNEYAIQLSVKTAINKDPYLDNLHLTVNTFVDYNLNLNYKHALRPIKILNYNEKDSVMEILLHLTTWNRHFPDTEYDAILKNLQNMIADENSSISEITRFSRIDMCMPTVTVSNNIELYWPRTKIGRVTLSKTPCLQINGKPVTRKCIGDSMFGAYWSDVNGICNTENELTEQEKDLQDLLDNEDITSSEISGNLTQITENSQNTSVRGIHLISEIFEKLETFDEDFQMNDIASTVSNVMNFDVGQLRDAQNLMNSTDKMLSSVDNILKKVGTNETSVSTIASSKLAVQMSDTKATEIIGIAVKNTNLNSFNLIPVYKNVSYDELLKDDFEFAACLIPDNFNFRKTNVINPEKLVMTLFNNDALFNEESTQDLRLVNQDVISILVPNHNDPVDIMVIHKSHEVKVRTACAYWKYGYDDIIDRNIQGRWLEDGKPVRKTIGNHTYMICKFNHTTHFALLTLNGDGQSQITKEHQIALDIITAIGTTLSLISIVLIFIIAFMYKNWRRRSSNKILLNFSAALALQMVLLFISDNIENEGVWCSAIGASLHYVILAQFFWMLIIAILQYRKYVIVFNNRIPYLVIKACVICWLLPLVPIAITVAVSSDSYKKNSHGLCYPIDEYFYYGLLLPIFVIIVVNIVVFLKIIFAVCNRKIEAYGGKESTAKLQILLAIFLFFLLGFSWIFGLASGFGGGIVFSYLFCVTATTQGLVLFLFFVIMSEKTKTVWVSMKQNWFSYGHKRKTSNSSCTPTQITE